MSETAPQSRLQREAKRDREADLGAPLHKFFSRVDSEPLASASIAQVHAATLVSGEEVRPATGLGNAQFLGRSVFRN